MADTIANVRMRRGTVRGRLTRIERDISSLEGKETLTPSERRKIKRLKDQVKEHDQEFEKRNMEVIDFIEEEDQAALDAEEQVFDEHINRVSDIMERLEKLEDLGAATEPVRPHVSTDPKDASSGLMRNQKCLKYLKTSLEKAKATIRLLEPMPALDICLVEKMKMDVDMLTRKLSDIVEDILSLPEDDTSSLNEATSMEDELGSMTLKLIKLTHDREKREYRTTDGAIVLALEYDYPRLAIQLSMENPRLEKLLETI